jgi:hypothetical protein
MVAGVRPVGAVGSEALEMLLMSSRISVTVHLIDAPRRR